MSESESKLVKAPRFRDVLAKEAPDSERPAEFEFSVTWFSVFPVNTSPKRVDLLPAPRVPTLVTSSKSAPSAEDWRNFLKPGAEGESSLTTLKPPEPSFTAPPAAQNTVITAAESREQAVPVADPASKSKVTWEMVVP